ncbi:hypothetical protein ACIA8O_01550 [Kitasatospora sp. NPDC051853]|uniref:hypothetical protein n=1 Tax=Kitasatospora sp. NPDC051853 TaxID=3364058 RepID=UPI00378A560B
MTLEPSQDTLPATEDTIAEADDRTGDPAGEIRLVRRNRAYSKVLALAGLGLSSGLVVALDPFGTSVSITS